MSSAERVMTPTRQTDESKVRGESMSDESWVLAWEHPVQKSMRRAGFVLTPKMSKASMIAAARAFTDARREEIRQVREEILYMQLCIEEQHDACGVEGCGCEDAAQRTLGRLEAHLQGLLRGWKECE